MDSISNIENDASDCKYDPMVQRNTLHKHFSRVIDTIEPQKKHAFVDILLNSLNLILSCTKCKSTLKKNSASFNCGHNYCEQCIKNLNRCTNCNEGTTHTILKNFSNILSILNQMKSNFNSDKIMYELMRYSLMPQKFCHIEEVVETAEPNTECTPSDSIMAENVDLKKSRKSAMKSKKSTSTPSALKNSRKKLEFHKKLNQDKNSIDICNSDGLFLETAKNKEKNYEKKQSYIELQMPVMELKNLCTPVSNANRKRKTSESHLELQPTISEMIKTTLDSNNKRKRKSNDSESSDQKFSESKRAKMKTSSENLLINDEKSESENSCEKTSRQNLKSQRSSDSPKQGEEKQQNVIQPKINLKFHEDKSTSDEVKTSFAPSSDMDTDLLDLDVWKHHDKYEKKKNLFKSVKERNKRSISIGGSLRNLSRRSPKKQSFQLNNNAIENGGTKKIREMDLPKDDKTVTKDSNLTNSLDKKNEEILKEPVPKIEISNKRTLTQTSLLITLETTPSTKQSPVKSNNSCTGSIEVKKYSELTFANDEKKIDNDSESIETTAETKNFKSESLEDSTSEFDIYQVVGKKSTEVSQEIENPICKESLSKDQKEENSIKTTEVEEPALEEPTEKSREVLAEITDHHQNAMVFEYPIHKHKTSPFTKSDTSGKKHSKLGVPLFPEINQDIFSQKGNLCSSTPCVGMMKKVSKTYSKAKNSLFNGISPVTKEKTFEGALTFLDISPIVERVRSNDSCVIISDKIAGSPKTVETCPKPSTYEDSQKNVTESIHVVEAEVHEVPCTPKIQMIEKSPKLTQPEKQNKFVESLPSKDCCSNDIIPMEFDNVFETVNKVTDNILFETSNSIIDLENEVQPVDSNVEREIKRNKVKKLQESINNKTEKTFSSLKKNFNKSSSKLSVEKFKSCVNSTTPAKNSYHLSQVKSSPLKDKKKKNEISTTISNKISSDYHDAPTQKRCASSKSVGCQTSPDLHLALLKQEFPHLFEKYFYDSMKKDYPLSVYDTPVEPINGGVKIIANTPDICLLNTTAKFTRVSSITSSEKKRADELFINQSVLGDASFNVISADKTTNISDYTPLSPQTQNGKKKLSCRLNFDDDDDSGKEGRPEDVTLTNRIKLDEDSTLKNAHDFTIDKSNEIDFSDDVIVQKKEEVMLSTSVLKNNNVNILAMNSQLEENEDSNKTFFEFDKPVTPASSSAKEDKDSTLMIIRDTNDLVQIDNDEEKNQVVTDDDDDIDFVAGTPTSQPRRLIAENLEKNRTPLSLLRKPLDITLHEFSIVGNTTPNTSLVQPLTDISQYSEVKKRTSVEITPIDEPVKKREPDTVSLELFNSSVSVFSPAPEKILIATSGLKETDIKIIKEFCKKFFATYVDKLTDESTHLVVKTNHKNRSARTFKYLQAIVSQIRIVSMKWIHECLTKEKLINEEKYIPMDSSGECGPLRTYHVIKEITPSPLSWLTDYCIYFIEPVPQECTLEQLQIIMRKTGAIVINCLREFKMYPNHHHVIIISDDEDCDDEYNMKIAGWLQSYEAVSLEFNWILEVIGRNRLMPFVDFEVIEIPNEYLLQRNFPSIMLQSNEEDQNSSD